MAAVGNRTADHSASRSVTFPSMISRLKLCVYDFFFVTQYPNLSVSSAFLDKNIFFIEVMCRYEVKGKEAPLQAWSGPECSRKLRFPDFMTTAQDGGKVVSLTHRPPLPQEIHLVLISVRS